jgi:DNA invertase Pin-like site-specific DNA recombinase
MRRNAKPAPTGRIRCAIYTRKSTEEGLDQDFNSLDAQREACTSYINSQRHEGWTLLPHLADDGGFSGGNMERPGLQRLLAEVKAGRVDVIVVYKVDRLTCSLTDLAKIVEVLDGAGASFVSVTQSSNTTTSMGRLTLAMAGRCRRATRRRESSATAIMSPTRRYQPMAPRQLRRCACRRLSWNGRSSMPSRSQWSRPSRCGIAGR